MLIKRTRFELGTYFSELDKESEEMLTVQFADERRGID